MTMNFSPVQGATTPKPFNNLGIDITPPSIPVEAPSIEPVKPDSFNAAAVTKNDSAEPEIKEKGKGPIRALKDFVRAAKKLGINISEYTKGTLSGAVQGFAVGAGVFTIGSVYKGIKNAIKKPSKMPVKFLAVASGLATVAYNYWKTSLTANEKKADVDHRYTTTPVLDKK